MISWIFSLKNTCLVFLTVPLNIFQLLICLNVLYFDSTDWYSSFHHSLECFVILTYFECFCHKRFEILIDSWTMSSSDSLSVNWEVLIFLTFFMSSEVKFKYSSLFLMIVHLLSFVKSLIMWILTTRGAWLEGCYDFGRIVWLSNSNTLGLRNIRLMIEFELFSLSKYLVGTELVECKSEKSKESAISTSKLLWIKWNVYEGS